MAKRRFNQPSFNFDAPDEPLPPKEWCEVPQTLFLSWSPAMQYSYCAARDRDSAAQANSEEWKQFYLERAKEYEQCYRTTL